MNELKSIFLLSTIIVLSFVGCSMVLRAGQGDQYITPADVDNLTRQQVQNMQNREKLGW